MITEPANFQALHVNAKSHLGVPLTINSSSVTCRAVLPNKRQNVTYTPQIHTYTFAGNIQGYTVDIRVHIEVHRQ